VVQPIRQSNDAGDDPPAVAALHDTSDRELERQLEDLGLSPYESRLVLALLELGSANTIQLARLSGVPRTSTYRVLEELQTKALVNRVEQPGPAVWRSPGADEVMDRLETIQEARLSEFRERAGRVRSVLGERLSGRPGPELPYLHFVHDFAQAARIHNELMRTAENELLMFTRGPYARPPDTANPVVLEMMARGVEARVLYDASELESPEGQAYVPSLEPYHRAGVQGRVAESLPMKLAVFDRQKALLTVADPLLPQGGFSTTLHVDHAGFAEVLTGAFEDRWKDAQPFPTSP